MRSSKAKSTRKVSSKRIRKLRSTRSKSGGGNKRRVKHKLSGGGCGSCGVSNGINAIYSSGGGNKKQSTYKRRVKRRLSKGGASKGNGAIYGSGIYWPTNMARPF